MIGTTKFNLLLIGFACFISFGCKKSSWYEEKPDRSLFVPSTLKDMQAILDNAEIFNRNSPSLGEIGSDGHSISDIHFGTLPPMDRNAYTWSKAGPYLNLIEWNSATSPLGSYTRIYQSNLVLEGLTKIQPGTEEEQNQWNNIKGQALFHRGRTFFELSQIFAPPYNAASAGSDLGIPLRLESDVNLKSTRSSVKDTYTQIISDLQSALKLLSPSETPDASINKTRSTIPAAYALLARVYLSMELYNDAKLYADSCLNRYSKLLDYANITPASSSRTFRIFNEEVVWHAGISEQLRPAQTSRILIDTFFYNEYHSDDLRKSYFFIKGSTTVTFRGQYTGLSSLFTGLATDEIYLIRAECLARIGSKDAAMKDLNDLLRKRWKKDLSGNSLYVDQTAIDANDALAKILQERKKELLCRGIRWSDLRRLNRDDRFKITITRITPGGTFTLEPNSYKYTYPIPDDVIAISGMPQNPGWE